MSRVCHPILARRGMAGLSLIEMMIALVMALIVAAGIITVFTSTSGSNKVQRQLAALQEEGRFAIHSLRQDLGNANGGYCSNTGGNAGVTSSGLYLDALRTPIVYAKNQATVNSAFHDDTTPLDAPTEAFSIPSRMFMRGYDCGTNSASCKPVDPATDTDIPEMGTAAGKRVVGSSVLTIRYLKPGSGWAIVESAPGSTIDAGSDGGVTTITLSPLTGEDPVSAFTGSLAMLADCSNAQVFSVSNSSGTLTPNDNFASPIDITRSAAPRVFDFTNDFQTVTYYLRVVDVGNGHTTGELVRRVNGGTVPSQVQPLVRGVERLNFRYGIIDANGNTQFLTADEVDTATNAGGSSIPCPPDVSNPGGMDATGCLWRAVQTIEVHVLMDGQTPLYTLAAAEMNYIYSPDDDTVPVAPGAHAIQPSTQGFPDQLLRREFITVVPLRNFNP